jgi:hypothetical protein
MKHFLILTLLVSFGAFASTPIEKMVPVDHIYVPAGFDSNDTTEVVVTGFLPNLCHKSPSAMVTTKGNKIDIKVTSLYYHESNPFCPEMVVPFVETVKLGLLNKGDYEIKVNGKSQWELKEQIKVSQSTSTAVDDHSYAYVNYVDKEQANGEVVLKGYNPSDCFVLDKIEHRSNGKDTYSVLPIMKQVRSFCPMKMTPFSYKWRVPTELDSELLLLHVRTLDGKSVNSIYYQQ